MKLIEEISHSIDQSNTFFIYLLIVSSIVINFFTIKFIFREKVVLPPTQNLIFIAGKISKKLGDRIINYSNKVKNKKENFLGAKMGMSVLIIFSSFFISYFLLNLLLGNKMFNLIGYAILPIAMLLLDFLLFIIFKWFYQRIYLKHIKKHIYNYGKEIIDEISLDK